MEAVVEMSKEGLVDSKSLEGTRRDYARRENAWGPDAHESDIQEYELGLAIKTRPSAMPEGEELSNMVSELWNCAYTIVGECCL